MIKDIYIYGTTLQFDITPIDESAGYYECFYDGSTIEKKFIVSQSNNTVRYNYLRYNNIIGSGGRDNSFFGLCVVFENEYVSKPYRLFQLFEYVFNKLIQNNKIFTIHNGNYKYKGSFNDISNEVEDLRITLRQAIQTTFSNDIVQLTTNLNVPYHSNVSYFNYNRTDLDDTVINQAFLQKGRIEFSNKQEEIEIISIEQFFEFKKELKKYSDFRIQFLDNTTIIQNDWITNTDNQNSYRYKITEAINTSLQQLQKIQPIVNILSKNQNLANVADLNRKYIENFNSINENRERLKSLLNINGGSAPVRNPGPGIPQPGTGEHTGDRKIFPWPSKYSKPILLVVGLSILSILGYNLYPPKKDMPRKPEGGTITTPSPSPTPTPTPTKHEYSFIPEVDSIIYSITISAEAKDAKGVIDGLDYLKTKYKNEKNYQLKPTFKYKTLSDYRDKFSPAIVVKNPEEPAVRKPRGQTGGNTPRPRNNATQTTKQPKVKVEPARTPQSNLGRGQSHKENTLPQGFVPKL
jgi:hypothetical protein